MVHCSIITPCETGDGIAADVAGLSTADTQCVSGLPMSIDHGMGWKLFTSWNTWSSTEEHDQYFLLAVVTSLLQEARRNTKALQIFSTAGRRYSRHPVSGAADEDRGPALLFSQVWLRGYIVPRQGLSWPPSIPFKRCSLRHHQPSTQHPYPGRRIFLRRDYPTLLVRQTDDTRVKRMNCWGSSVRRLPPYRSPRCCRSRSQPLPSVLSAPRRGSLALSATGRGPRLSPHSRACSKGSGRCESSFSTLLPPASCFVVCFVPLS